MTLSVNFKDVPGLSSASYSWKEMYSGKTGTGTSVSFSLGSHDMAVVLVTTSGSSSPSTTSTSAAPTSTSGGGSGCQSAKWDQCGGKDWKGCTVCASGSTCTFSNGKLSVSDKLLWINIWLTVYRLLLSMCLKHSFDRLSSCFAHPRIKLMAKITSGHLLSGKIK